MQLAGIADGAAVRQVVKQLVRTANLTGVSFCSLLEVSKSVCNLRLQTFQIMPLFAREGLRARRRSGLLGQPHRLIHGLATCQLRYKVIADSGQVLRSSVSGIFIIYSTQRPNMTSCQPARISVRFLSKSNIAWRIGPHRLLEFVNFYTDIESLGRVGLNL